VARRDTPNFQQAFESLYRQCHALARRILVDEELADAVASEALARAYARWKRVQTLPHPEGWVLRLTGNLAVATLDRPEPGTALGLAEGLAVLPPRLREPVVLCYLTELDTNEVGLVLGASPETVHARVREGLIELKRHIGARGMSDVRQSA
jgi:DNA-directed RNA polymerase specialized sigma24 family protein